MVRGAEGGTDGGKLLCPTDFIWILSGLHDGESLNMCSLGRAYSVGTPQLKQSGPRSSKK